MTAPTNLTTEISLCEDTDQQFDILALLAQAGYVPPGEVLIDLIYVLGPDGSFSEAPNALVQIRADRSGFIITASNAPDWNGTFQTFTMLIESGTESFSLEVNVTVDAVNDAPEGADRVITLADASGYVLKESDFGFDDPVEGDAFRSVLISGLPATGRLLLNGVALAAGAEVAIADIRAGRLVYAPPAGGVALDSIAFQVRDDGGTAGCNAADLDPTPNVIHFQSPLFGRIGDQVWLDADRDGVQDANEGGVAGVAVSLAGAGADGLFGTADDISRSTVTGSDGRYLFDSLAAGLYQVRFGTVPGYQFTSPDVGDDATDSDANAVGLSQFITLQAGETNLTVDAGLVSQVPVETYTAQLGDRVWIDSNGNGVQDGTETGAAGVTVRLLNAGGQVLATQQTAADGSYLFSGLGAGQYAVQVVAPTGYRFTAPNAGSNDAADSDMVWNGTGTQTGTSGLVTLQVGESNRTVDAGVQVCLVRVGDRVWLDADRDGVQDAGEAGVAGVTLALISAGADGVLGTADDLVRTTTTDASGAYVFSNVAWGQYRVDVYVPGGMALTTANAGGNDAADSDFQLTGQPAVANLIANGSFESGSAGWTGLGDTIEVSPASWFGVYGATGSYVAELDANVAGSGTGLYQDVQTEAGRVYQLSLDVAARSGTAYATNSVEVWWGNSRIATIDPTSTTLSTYSFNVAGTGGTMRLALREQAGDDDSLGGIIDNVRLSSAGSPTTTSAFITVDSCDDLLTVDAGLVLRDTNTASLGDRVWYDTDRDGVQDSNEYGASGISVTLAGAGADGQFGTADDVSRSTTTNSAGNYSFTGLAAGQYQVRFGGKSGYSFTTANATGDAADSDADVGTGKSHVVTLGIGESNQTVDAGLVTNIGARIVTTGGASGTVSMNEGNSLSFRVQLDQAVTQTTQLWVQINDGTAYRTDFNASSQIVHADPRWLSTDWSMNPTSYQSGHEYYDLRGPSDQSWDYGVYNTSGALVGSSAGFYVTIAAGSASSATFKVSAWREFVDVDRDGSPNYGTRAFTSYQLLTGAYKEASVENFSFNLSTTGSTGGVVVSNPTTTVKIFDTSYYDVTSPIVLDLDGNGVQTTALGATTGRFDLLGDGRPVASGWVSAGDALLAVDSNENGLIDSIGELFGGRVGQGFAKLASFDSNGDGVVDSNDAGFASLLVWQDANGNHTTDAGELRTLADAGVAALNLGHVFQNAEQNGNILGETSTAVRSDGSAIEMIDVYFQYDAAGLPALDSLVEADNALLDGALGAAVARAQPAMVDAGVEAASEAQRLIAAAMQHADATLACGA